MEKQEAEMLMQEIIEKQKEKKIVEDYIENLRTKLKVYLKENNIPFFEDEFGNIATLQQRKRETFDKEETLRLLGEVQFKECVKFRETNFEVFTVLSKESKEKIKSFLGDTT